MATIRYMAAHIRIERPAGGGHGRLRSWAVVLDGEKVGKLARGEWLSVRTDPGRHALHFTSDWMRSPELTIDLADGQTIGVECWPNGNPLFWPYWLTLGRTRAIGSGLLPEDSTYIS